MARAGAGLRNPARREFLINAARTAPLAILAPLPLRAVANALPAPNTTHTLSLLNTHTNESLSAAFRIGSQFVAENLARFSFLLRDHRNGAVRDIDPTLFDLLHDVAQELDVEPHFEVISGYRSPETNAALHARSSGVASHSLHMQGKAIDVRLVGISTKRLFETSLKLARGGSGYYGKPNFAHLDTGRVRRWGG